MGESSQGAYAPSRENIRTIVPERALDARACRFGRVVIVLWPQKPAYNLASRAGMSERMAQYIIDGRRKPNARAVLAVHAEIIS